MTAKKTPEQLRSYRWFGPDTMRGFSHRSRMMQLGFRREDFTGKPVIGIINTWSEINPCHAHLRERAEAVKRGVWQAGGFPVEIPAFSITETYMKPSPMLYRNLLAMDTEEALRSLPVDGAVLMGGCDKTTPGLLMGAISMNLPAIFLPAGPMLRGNWNGQPLGSGTDLWKYWTERCAGTITEEDWNAIEGGIARSPGFCMTMGTAATMTALTEALGMTLPGASSIPAADSNHVRMAIDSGRRIVEMVWEDARPEQILTLAAFRNAITVDMAIGGSTNAIIHLVALARRCGLDLPLRLFDEIAPVHLANEDRLLSALGPAERAELAGLLRRLLASFENSTARVIAPLGAALLPAHIARSRRAGVGLTDPPGLLVAAPPLAGTPAAAAGLQQGDLITTVNDCEVRSCIALEELLSGAPAGVPLCLSILRADQPRRLQLTLASQGQKAAGSPSG